MTERVDVERLKLLLDDQEECYNDDQNGDRAEMRRLIRALAAERDKALVERDAFRECSDILENARLQAENERLKGLVEEAKQYAVHRSFCARDLSYAKCPCDCGYADWLARAEEDAK